MSLTVADLLRVIGSFPADTPVVLSKDGEGNSFSPLAEAADGLYVAESPWRGDTIHPEDLKNEPEDYEGMDIEKVVVLWPTA